MKLSAPVHVLRGQAKKLKKSSELSLVAAQDKIAQQEGFVSWSHLIAKQRDLLPNSLEELLDYFNPGDLVLVGARPKKGKTLVTASLIAASEIKGAPQSHVFTLVEHEHTVRDRIEAHLEQVGVANTAVNVDCSDEICASYIVDRLQGVNLQGALVVVDYLQLLDERRTNPTLQNQLESLRLFAIETGCIILFIAQLSRKVDEKPNVAPTENDIRLPNPLDLRLFNKLMFLHKLDERHPGGEDSATRLCIRKPHEHEFALRTKKHAFALETE